MCLSGKKVSESFQICSLSNPSATENSFVFSIFLQETDLAKLWKNLTKFLNVNKYKQKL